MLCVVAVSLLAAACSDDPDVGEPAATGDDDDTPAVTLTALSTRPEFVTGGDVLVQVEAASDNDAAPTFTVDGDDVDATVYDDQAGRTVALISGLAKGDHEIAVDVGDDSATLDVTNHPTTGPLFSGEQQPMPVCTTDLYGLGPATDDLCSAESKVTWSYRRTDGEVADLTDPMTVPDDVVTIEDGPNAGKPFIMRTERGVLNRGIYAITVLDPEPKPDAVDTQGWDQTTWNGRLVYLFGGGCGVTYTQGFYLLGEADPTLLTAGYAVATSTLNTFQVACNDIVSAETALMVKEHFSETYAPPTFTIGNGGSGGAIQQFLVTQNYPGILDAVTASVPFPDAFSIAPGVVDCVLLNAYYRIDTGTALDADQRAAINGHLTDKTCNSWEGTFARNLKPDDGCSLDALGAARRNIPGIPEGGPPKIPEDMMWSEENPTGLRCTLQDGTVNVLGTDPATGYANRPVDNTGVQYGLEALNEAAITVDQFLDLNDQIGGADINGELIPERMVAEDEHVETVYGSGRVSEGVGDLLNIPIIAANIYTDDQGDIHDRFRAFSLRDRLEAAAGGDAPNYMIWTRGLPKDKTLVDSLTGTVNLSDMVPTVDDWLTALAEDDGSGSRAEQLERTRPEAAVDNCIDANGERVSGLDVYDGPGPCTDPYPISGDPRTAAGTPRRNDMGKCHLQTVEDALAGDLYAVDFDDDQQRRLTEIFPDGVCDYTQEAAGWVEVDGTWQSF